MEAGGIPFGEWVRERFKSHDSRIRSIHDKASHLERELGKQDRSLIEMRGELRELKEDTAEVRKTLNRIVWGLFGAIAVGLMFVVAVGTLIIQAAH